MKTMKRGLSLLMALVMVLGLAPVGKAEDSLPFSKDDFLGSWEGEYDGFAEEIIVQRHFAMTIDRCETDGTISGILVISPSREISSPYDENGSYYFDGTVDFQTGAISFQGHTWIQYPDIPGNHVFFSFDGTMDLDLKITGINDGKSNRTFYANKIDGTQKDKIDDKSTSEVKIGDYVEFGHFNDKPIKWQIINIDGEKALLFSSEVLFFGEYDASISEAVTGKLLQYLTYASCDWEHSDIRQYLNSRDASFKPQDTVFDYSRLWHGYANLDGWEESLPSYAGKAGFLSSDNFTSEEIAMIFPTSHDSLLPLTHPDAQIDRAFPDVPQSFPTWEKVGENYSLFQPETTTDSMFLLNAKEVKDYLVDRGFDYQDIVFDGIAQEGRYWLRDSVVHFFTQFYEYHGCYNITVESGGSPSDEWALASAGVRPACYVQADKLKVLAGDESTVVPENSTYSASFIVGTGEAGVLPTLSNVKWDDNWFNQSATEYNHELARTSMALSAAAYMKDGDTKNGINGEQNMKKALKQFGFPVQEADFEFHYEDKKPTRNDNDKVSFTLAAKKIQDEGGKDVTLVLINIKGTSTDYEWYSNFNIGEDGKEHAGFQRAFIGLATDLNSFLVNLKRSGYTIDSSTKFLVTGHSRGGGVANMVGAYLTNGVTGRGLTLLKPQEFKQNNIFCYTFAAPMPRSDGARSTYNNIFNIVNPEDFVPRLPLKQWLFGRYGVDRILPSRSFYGSNDGKIYESTQVNKSSYDKVYSKMQKEYKELMAGSGKEDYHAYPDGTQAVVKLQEDIYNLAPTTYYVYHVWHGLELKYGGPTLTTMSEYFENLADFLVNGDKLVKTFVTGSFGRYGAISRFFLVYEGTDIPIKISPTGKINPLIGEEIGKIKASAKVFAAHSPAGYLSWMYGCEEEELFQFEAYSRSIIACPVDVNVYSEDGTLVASVVNEEVVVNTLAVGVEDGKKVIDIPHDQQYSVEITAREAGTVKYSVKEFTVDDTDITSTRTVAFNTIDIVEGDVLTGEIAGELDSPANDYALTLNDEEVILPDREYIGDDPELQVTSTYTLTVTAPDKGGTLTVTPQNPAPGDTVSITPKGDRFYVLDTLAVRDKTDTPVLLRDDGHGVYSFPMPNGDVSVSAAFVHVCPSGRFQDVKESDWFHDAVDDMVDRGVMYGVFGDAFAPNSNMTRGMVVTTLHRLEGQPAAAGSNFRDVRSGDWFAAAVNWAVSQGIVYGYGDGTFGPNDPLTREQMAAILYRYAGQKGRDMSAGTLSGFTDAAQVSPWATTAMGWANQAGIITGMTATTLEPQGPLTRAQIATILSRFTA